MASFSEVGVSPVILVGPGDTANYTLDDGLGTFAGTILLESSEGYSAGWVTEATKTANATGSYVNQTNKPRYVRLRCTAYTGDAMTYTLSVGTDVSSGLRFDGASIVDDKGTELITFSPDAVTFGPPLQIDIDASDIVADTLTVSGATVLDSVTASSIHVASGATTLDALTVTGATGVEALTVGGDLVLDAYMSVSTASKTAYAGGGQANATAITSGFTNITVCATALDSVKLPSSVVGQVCEVKNTGAAAAAVYPQSGGSVNGTTNGYYRLEPGLCQRFVSTGANAWQSTVTEQPIGSYAIITKSSNDTLSSLAQVKTLMPGTFTTVNKSSDFTVTGAGGRLQYTGSKTKYFMLTAQMEATSSAIRTLYIQVSQDGGSTFVTGLDQQIGYAAAGGYQSIIYAAPISMATNAYCDFYFYFTTSSANLTIGDTYIVLRELVGV